MTTALAPAAVRIAKTGDRKGEFSFMTEYEVHSSERLIAYLTKHEYFNGSITWTASRKAGRVFGHGKTAEGAVCDMFTSYLRKLQKTIDETKTISVMYGDDILAAAKELE